MTMNIIRSYSPTSTGVSPEQNETRIAGMIVGLKLHRGRYLYKLLHMILSKPLKMNAFVLSILFCSQALLIRSIRSWLVQLLN